MTEGYKACHKTICWKHPTKPPLFLRSRKGNDSTNARTGVQVEIKSREVIAYDFEITNINLPNVAFQIHCGKGTYIDQSLMTLGELLELVAISKVLSTAIGNHNLSDSITIETFEKTPMPDHEKIVALGVTASLIIKSTTIRNGSAHLWRETLNLS